MTPLSYPAEWLLDIFNNGAKCRRISREPYLCMITTPGIPWILEYGWRIIAGLLVVEIVLGGFLCHAF